MCVCLIFLCADEVSEYHQLAHTPSVSCADSIIRADLSLLVKVSPLIYDDGSSGGSGLEVYEETRRLVFGGECDPIGWSLRNLAWYNSGIYMCKSLYSSYKCPLQFVGCGLYREQ